jgi:hypothetical protein
LTLDAVLRCADEHFDQVVVQTIIELALEAPFELRMVQIARVQIEVIGVYWDTWILELDDQFNAIALGASIEIEQWMLVEAELSENTFEAWIVTFSHRCIVKAIERNFGLD